MFVPKLVAENWPILVILLATLLIHLFRLDSLITIGGDQGYDLLKIKGILEGDLTLLGPPIGRFRDTVLYLGPLYYYLQAPFLMLFKLDPVGQMVPIIISRLATTFFVYLASKKLFNRQAATISAIVAGVSPYFLEKLGQPSLPYLIPAVVSIIIFLFIKSKKTAKTFVLLGFLSGLMVHLHYLGLSVFLALAIFACRLKEQKLKSLAFLFFGFILSISPLLLFEARNNFFLTRQIASQLTKGVIGTQTPLMTDQIISSINFLTKDIIGVQLPFIISLLLIITAAALALKPKKEKIAIAFLISIVVINLAAVGLYRQEAQPHYLAAVYVPLFILAGATIARIAKFGKFLPLVLTLVITVALIKGNDLERTSGYTMPEDLTLRQIRQISKLIVEDVGSETFNITSTLDGDSRAMPYRYLTEVYGKTPEDVQNYDKGQNLYIITRDPASHVRASSLFEIASFQPSFIESTWNMNGDIKLIKLSKQERKQPESPKFITIVNPVRPRQLWNDQRVEIISSQIKQITDRNLKATWLLSYENLADEQITDLFKNQKDQEIGAFLEVSEKWATDSHVVYKIAEGDYYRPDKVFPSGYSPLDREKLIRTYFKKFRQVFTFTPKSVGAWYIDANTQNLLAKLGTTSLLTVSDQFDTDAASIWGKYWSMPFYPSKYNSLEPAKSQSDKLPVVNLQWAQRDLTAGYGREIKDSRQSFQANDYINNGYDTSYFRNLLASYLANAQNNDFIQITIGLEAGQEAQRFAAEFEKQLDIAAEKQKSGEAKTVTMEEFANWYHGKYPGISPSHLLKKDDSFWYMTPKFRVAVFSDNGVFKIKDLRYYGQYIFEDAYYSDKAPYLRRNIPAIVDGISLGNEIDLGRSKVPDLTLHFDRLTLKLDNRLYQINQKGVEENGVYITASQIKDHQKYDQKRIIFIKIKDKVKDFLSVFKFSVIGGKRIFGLSLNGTTIVGFQDLQPGIYRYDFQVAARFLSPARLIENWQP